MSGISGQVLATADSGRGSWTGPSPRDRGRGLLGRGRSLARKTFTSPHMTVSHWLFPGMDMDLG